MRPTLWFIHEACFLPAPCLCSVGSAVFHPVDGGPQNRGIVQRTGCFGGHVSVRLTVSVGSNALSPPLLNQTHRVFAVHKFLIISGIFFIFCGNSALLCVCHYVCHLRSHIKRCSFKWGPDFQKNFIQNTPLISRGMRTLKQLWKILLFFPTKNYSQPGTGGGKKTKKSQMECKLQKEAG